MGVIAIATSEGFGAVIYCLLILHTIPIIVFHALGIGKSEDAAALAEDVIALGGLPEGVVVDDGGTVGSCSCN